MFDLLEALTIFSKYAGIDIPVEDRWGMLLVKEVGHNIPKPDYDRLRELGFFWSPEFDCWASYRFGV